MLFKRRQNPGFGERLRLVLWPRRSFSRSLQYFGKRVLRLRATPHAVAAGVAAGIFASFFPLGLHFVIAMVVAWLVAGNLVAAAIATAFGNPLTVPFLWGASYETGLAILHRPLTATPHHLGQMLHHLSLAELWQPVLMPMTVGAVPLGLGTALVFYALTRWGMTRFRQRREARIAGKRSMTAGDGSPVHS